MSMILQTNQNCCYSYLHLKKNQASHVLQQDTALEKSQAIDNNNTFINIIVYYVHSKYQSFFLGILLQGILQALSRYTLGVV